MNSQGKGILHHVVVVLTIASMLGITLIPPFHSTPVYAREEAQAGRSPTVEIEFGRAAFLAQPDLKAQQQMPHKVYLPLVSKNYQPPASAEALIQPGKGGEVGAPDGSVRATFSAHSVQQDTWARYQEIARPMITAPNLAVGGPAFSLAAWQDADKSSVTEFPPEVQIIPATQNMPGYAVITPSITVAIYYTDADVWGLDLRSLSLYTRQGPGAAWERVPTAVYQERRMLIAQVEQTGEFVPLAPLSSISAQTRSRLALDPDDDVGSATWPGTGTVREITYNMRLAREVEQRLQDDQCRVDILTTRDSESQRFVARTIRAQMAQNFGVEMFTTLAFNACGANCGANPLWGQFGDGGTLVWSGPDADDSALGNQLLEEMGNLSRPHKWGGTHAVLPYSEFLALPATYAHLETLYLDHRFDMVIIRDDFEYIADATYTAIRKQLEAAGMYCGDPNRPPSYPTPPSAEVLKRWRDLGYQNYQRYGADPVSFSTGNHVVQVRLARVPGRGSLDWDLTLTYNSQDPRSDLLGYGWSFPYNAHAQHYEDDSVSVALWDGRTYHYTANGSGYDAPAGVYDRLEKTAIGWNWITPNDVTLVFSETVGGFGIMTEWRDRSGNALHFSYDLSKQNVWQNGEEVPRPPLTEIRDDAGRKITVQSDDQSRITRLGLWDGRAYTFEYDGEGNLTRINGPDGQLRRFEYDVRHRMTKEWDAEGILFLQSVYDDRDRVIEQVDASRTHSYLAYDVTNRQTTFTDNAGHTEVYDWDTLNRVTGEQDGRGGSVSNVYDADYNLTSRTDANGNTTRYEYDARGNLIARYDPIPAGSTYQTDVTRWAYDARNNVISMTNALGRTWLYEYNSQGNLIRAIAPDGSATRATYNAWGQPTSVTDALTRTTTYQYDTYGNLLKTTYPDGTFSSSTYDAAGRETSYTDANGHTVQFVYDARDNITRITDPKSAASLFEYDGNDLLTRSVDRRGGERLYQYDENLKLVGERDPLGLWTRYGYNALYQRVTMTDTAGHVTRYEYDEAGRLIAVTDPAGGITRYTHDPNGNVIIVTDALGHTSHMIYDANNRLKYQIDPLGHITEYCYDAEDQLVRVIGPRREVTDYTYDALGRLIAVKDPLGNVTRYEHDAVGNRTAVVDPLARRTDTAFDAMNRVAAIQRPDLPPQAGGGGGGSRPTTRFAYDAVGNTLVITSPLGFVTRLEYDANDNTVKVVDPLGGETVYTYDAEDTPVAVIDANGHTVATTYNLAGLPVQTTDALGYTTTMEYDAAYNLVKTINAMGKATTYDYDPLGRLLQTVDPLNHKTTYTRDALGRVTAVTDANAHTTAYDYDALGRLIAVTDPLSGTTRYGYDTVGNLTVITDANAHVTTFDYNFLNQLTLETNPLSHTWQYAYDAAGQLVRRVDAMWQATYYDYDSNGRLVRLHYGAVQPAQPPVTFTYDLEGRETQMCDGLPALSSVEGGCTTHGYDALGRPITTTDWLGRTITRTYDAVGNLAGLTYPNGYAITYTYNANRWLTTFTDPHGDSSLYTHNRLGQVTQIQHANGTRSELEYDAAGRLTGLANLGAGGAAQSAYRYMMDAVGNRVRVVEERAPFNGVGANVALTHTYQYDALDRLIQAATEDPASDTAYAFDPVGNRLSKTGTVLAPDTGVPELPVAPKPEQNAYTYNAANQLTAISGQQSAVGLDYNANGDRIHESEILTDGTTLLTDYRYDREDRLVGVTKTVSGTAAITVTMVATYTYDGYGRRALKEVVGYTSPITPHVSRLTYLYDGLDIIGAQLEVSGTVTETYYYPAPSPVTGLRRPLEMERLPNPAAGFAGDRYWYQSDGLDSVAALTDEGGNLASPFLYDEYGQMLAGKTELQVFAYTGQDYDVETGLYHFYARYYTARDGLWLEQDNYRGETMAPKSLHRFSYVHANPVNTNDWLGYATQGEIDRVKPLVSTIAEIYGVPPIAIAIVLELENKPGVSGGGRCPTGVPNNFCRQVKQYLNAAATIYGTKPHCSGGDCSLGLGNVKVGTAQNIINYFDTNYPGTQMAELITDATLGDLINDIMNTVFVAANLRWAMDIKGYHCPLTFEEIATIAQHHNNASWQSSRSYYNDAYELLQKVYYGGYELQFLDDDSKDSCVLFVCRVNHPSPWLSNILELGKSYAVSSLRRLLSYFENTRRQSGPDQRK
ncbi:MAG: hypothetical protein JW934_05930 [Anaerolineae bacterium]|nr:hypothetical protein [Anaerolineae bacterium]